MRILLLKTWRDMRAHWGQFAALILLVAIGITSYVAFVESYRNLKASADEAYERLKFADFSISVLGAPTGVVHKIERVPGVAAAEGRLVIDTGMDVAPGEQGTVRIVGVPPDRRPSVNDLLVQRGRYLEPSDLESALLHTKFAEDTGLKPGGRLRIRSDSVTHDIRIVGIAASPEYMFPTRSKNEIPSVAGFTILFMPQHEVERLFGKTNTVTDVAVRISSGADQGRVMDDVEEILEPYRIVASTPREDQPSAFSLAEEIDQNRVLATIMPTLILIISALSLAIALARLVQSQRGQIGLAKALGYTNGQVLAHYLFFAIAVAAVGSIVGLVVGHLLAMLITGEYTRILGVPYLTNRLYWDVMLSAVGMSTVACVLAGLVPAWTSARMTPARAMHADPNLSLRGGSMPVVERLFGRLLPAALVVRIPLRNIFRAKRRSAYTIIGIAFAVLLTLGTAAFYDSLQWLLNYHFDAVERWDVSAFYGTNLTDGQVRDIGRWEGVERVQAAFVLPVKISANGVTHEGVITAMDPAADFHGFEIVSGPKPEQALRGGDVVLARQLAEKLRVDVGDTVSVKSPYLDERRSIRVAALSQEALGLPAYANLTRGEELVGSTRPVYNALYLEADSRYADRLEDRLYDMPGAQQVVVKDSLLEGLRSMMSFIYFFFGILLAFGFAMAFVVIYNTFTANVIERTREIATMRTIGEDGAHLAGMVTLENLLLACVGLPLGVWLGLRMAEAVLASMSSEQFSLQIVVRPTTYVWVVLATIVVLLLSEIPPIRRIFRLDLAEATKVME